MTAFWRPLEAGFPALHRYVRLRKERLGLPELHMYDLFVPLAGGTDKRYPYEEGKRLILEGLKPLGEEYGKLLETGFSSRWIDVYENQGKRSGGYSRPCIWLSSLCAHELYGQPGFGPYPGP